MNGIITWCEVCQDAKADTIENSFSVCLAHAGKRLAGK